MSATYGMPLPPRPYDRHPLLTIREIRESLPDDQLVHFDAELAETDISELESMHTVGPRSPTTVSWTFFSRLPSKAWSSAPAPTMSGRAASDLSARHQYRRRAHPETEA